MGLKSQVSLLNISMKLRISKKSIPYGIYWYGLDSNGKHCSCPHWNSSSCKVAAINSEEIDDALLGDGCKICDIRTTVPARIIRKYSIRENGGIDKEKYREFRKQEDSSYIAKNY